ncbi:MAG: undecaprenyl-diphosphatase [Parcubacteria group bacterium Greene0714_7]|nr:MAG: undecaprenyl-diphosphatase [Parcubacteria group bacterium Greene0714_7]
MYDWVIFSILGLVEGITEFLPISSSGHLIIARELLGATGVNSLAVDSVLQLGTILAVVVYFSKDLLTLAHTAVKKVIGKPVRVEDGQLLLALIVGTVPAVFFGLFLESTMDTVFRNTHLVAYALIAGSVVFLLAEYVSKRYGAQTGMEAVGFWKAILIGLFQALALVPGMSRSGMTISGGLFLGLSREASARFGFLLSVPIILGAGSRKLLELAGVGGFDAIGAPLVIGSLVAFLSGLAAIHILLKFLRTHPLYVFAVYRVLVAVTILMFLAPF